MMYTKFIKGIIDLWVKGSIAVAALIALLVMFFGGDNFGNSFLIGIIIAVIIVFLALLPVALFGMLVEMSENMNSIRELLEKNGMASLELHTTDRAGAQNKPMKSNDAAASQSCSYNLTQLSYESTDKKKKEKDRWECPECGEMNPNATRVCRSCAYQK